MNRSKSVLHISTALSWRGGEQQIAYLIKGLEEMQWHSHLLCAAGSEIEQYARQSKLALDAVPKRWTFNPHFAKSIAKLAISRDFDLVHLHDAHAHNFAIIAADIFGMKLPMVLSRRVDFPIKKNTYSLYKYRHKQIAAILCVSEAIRQIIVPDLLRPEQVHTVHSGIDFQRFDQALVDGRLRSELSLPQNCKLIGNVAALAPHKDLLTFVAAADLILKQDANCHFVLIGDGSERAKIEKEILNRGLKDRISLLGFRKDLPSILPELDLAMISSKTEGLGTSIIDAMYCRVPIVATAAGGIPELVQGGETGLLSPIEDANNLATNAIKMLSDRSLAEHMTTQAYKSASNFSYLKTAQKTAKIYDRVIGGTQ